MTIVDALYYTAVRLEKIQRTVNRQRTDRQRIQLQRPLLSPWIVGVSGPIFLNTMTPNITQWIVSPEPSASSPEYQETDRSKISG